MRKPAKKYFSPSYGAQSIMLIRKWIASGATSVDIARWIKMEYEKAKDDAARLHLGHMLCAVMSATDTLDVTFLTRECANMFSIPQIKEVSLGEAAFLGMTALYGEEKTVWLDNFNPYFVNTQRLPSEMAPQTHVTRAMENCYNSNLVTVDQNNSIYFFRDDNTKVWLMIVDYHGSDILIDEAIIGRQPALYFTESGHFISPVWMIRQVAKILEYILRRIGYPPLNVYKKVIFDNSDATLVNEDDYRKSNAWEGVEVLTIKKKGFHPLMTPARPIIEKGNTAEGQTELSVMLYMSVMATAELLQCFPINKNNDITDSLIEEWCDRCSLFKPVNWDIILHDDFDDD